MDSQGDPRRSIHTDGTRLRRNGEGHLDVLDVESAVLTGTIDQVLTVDPRGTRFVIVGNATDQETPVAVVVRFVEQDQLLIITVCEIK